MVLLKLFGGISNSLVIVLQESIHVHKYLGVIMSVIMFTTHSETTFYLPFGECSFIK
jgi:hypothetical protein